MFEHSPEAGQRMAETVRELFPQNRSIVGPGIRSGFRRLANNFDSAPKFHRYISGTKFGNWRVPQGWELGHFQLKCSRTQQIIIHSNETNLRVWSHSTPYKGLVTKNELLQHVRVHDKIVDAIPYVTAYYSDTWGFSITQNELQGLCDGPFEVEIDASLADDYLEIMEVYIPGISKEEIFMSTYLCHPSMVVNELSGPVVAAELIRAIEKNQNYFSYRFVFIPETIGAIAYSESFLRGSKRKIAHAINLNCLGGFHEWSFLGSRQGDTYTDNLVKKFMADTDSSFKEYPFSSRGSDERQYCQPRINLPMVSLMRRKYHEYPEYHTNQDDLRFNNPEIYAESVNMLLQLCKIFECDVRVLIEINSEPFLNALLEGPKLGGQNHNGNDLRRGLCDFLMYSDGSTLVDICTKMNITLDTGFELLEIARSNFLVSIERSKTPKLRDTQL